MTEKIKILGHRGVRRHPDILENTIPAFVYGLEHADGVEADVVCSRDQVPYLLHDSSMRFIPYAFSWISDNWRGNLDLDSMRAADGGGINQLHSGEIDRMCLKDGSFIPRLTDLFKLAGKHLEKKILNLELKAPGTACPVVQAIDAAYRADRLGNTKIILTSFDHRELEIAQRQAPDIPYGPIFWQESFRSRCVRPWGEDHGALPVSIENIESARIRKILPDYFVLPVHALTEIYNDAVAQEYPRSEFIVWTPGREPLPQDNGALKKLLKSNMGKRIAAVITDHPKEMKEFMYPPPPPKSPKP